MTKIELKMGDTLHHATFLKGILHYKVIGLREYENVILYEIECENCTDHPNCRLLVTLDNNKHWFKYVSMVNEDEENKQYYWHDDNQPFFIDRDEAEIYFLNGIINKHKADIEQFKLSIQQLESRIEEIELVIKTLKENNKIKYDQNHKNYEIVKVVSCEGTIFKTVEKHKRKLK